MHFLIRKFADLPVFSSRVFGVFGLLIMSISWFKNKLIYGIVAAPEKENSHYIIYIVI